MKIRPKEDLNIHLDAENRDEIPGVPLTDDHAIASIEGENERQNSYLICNKCIKLCKESKTTEQT